MTSPEGEVAPTCGGRVRGGFSLWREGEGWLLPVEGG